MSFLRRFFRRRCSPDHPVRKHGDLVAIGDCIVCLRCGREKYAENWSKEEVARAVPLSTGNRTRVEAARKLPYGSKR